MEYFYLPCRPTISATCSELGTGTHSVIFWLFFGSKFRISSTAEEKYADSCETGEDSFDIEDGSVSPNIDNSSASCRALWSSRPFPPPLPPPLDMWWWSISPNRLAGITETILSQFVLLSQLSKNTNVLALSSSVKRNRQLAHTVSVISFVFS